MLRETLEGSHNGQKPFLSMSYQVLPEFREYERTSTVVVNAYVGPTMAGYLEALQKALGSDLRVMQSSGGSITASLASKQPVRTGTQWPRGRRGGSLPRRVPGWLHGHHNPGHGRHLHGRLPLPWPDKGDHLLQPGGTAHQRAHDRDPHSSGRRRLHRTGGRGRRPPGGPPVGRRRSRPGLLRQGGAHHGHRRQPNFGQTPARAFPGRQTGP